MAQFELVKRGEAGMAVLLATANRTAMSVTSRLNGVWGLGQLARQKNARATAALLELSKDSDAEVRANVARVLGEVSAEDVQPRLLELLADESPRVRSLAVIAMSRMAKPGDTTILKAIHTIAKANAGSDIVLRHACGTALKRLGTVESAVALASDASAELRLLAVLQLRHLQSTELARFLTDNDATIRDEAIRAIYDTAALDTPAGDALAQLKLSADMPPLVQRRVVCASYRRGNAELLLQHAANAALDSSVREAALHGLRLWEKKITADPVLGGYRPIPGTARSLKELGSSMGTALKQFLASNPPPKLAALALKLADDTGVVLDAPTLIALVNDAKQQAAVRVAALDSLAKSSPDDARKLASAHLADAKGEVAAAALRHGLTMKLDGLAAAARQAMESGPIPAARAGVDVIASLHPAEALERWTQRESNGLRRELWLDLFLALQTSTDAKAQQTAMTFAAKSTDAVPMLSITGGDAKAGETVFRNQGACMQCHKIGRDGGIQGPVLDLVAERLKPEKLVESLVNPNAEIAAGYGMSSVTLSNGTQAAGRITEDTPQQLSIVGLDGKVATYPRDQVKTVTPPVSAMPPMGLSLPPKMLRDLLAFLRTRDHSTAPKQSGEAHGDEREKVVK